MRYEDRIAINEREKRESQEGRLNEWRVFSDDLDVNYVFNFFK